MITKTRFIESKQVVPYANLALENHLLESVAEETCILYLWQNQRTVVIGRNQNAWRECRTTELAADGGYLARRLSGGGAVFHDLGNLNFTILLPTKDFDVSRQLEVILQAMRHLGLAAERSGRNDVTIEGRKFSGNAFYDSRGHSYHHGTLLVDVDMDALSRYLQVDPQKLASKGVASVRSRVVNLKDLLPELTLPELKGALLKAFGEVYGAAPEPYEQELLDQTRLAELEAHYASWQWNYGAKIPFTHSLKQRFAWGGVEILLHVDKGQIVQAQVYSDALDAELFAAMSAALTGVRYDGAAIAQALTALSDAAAVTELARYVTENI